MKSTIMCETREEVYLCCTNRGERTIRADAFTRRGNSNAPKFRDHKKIIGRIAVAISNIQDP